MGKLVDADVPDKNVGDTISRRAAIDAAVKESQVNGAYGYMDTKSIVDLLNNLPSAEPRWILCSERLPEYGIDVLTVDGYGEYEINHIIDEEDGEWYWEPATAWMPLPEPWKGE